MWCPGPSLWAPSAGSLSREAHPNVLGGISERFQQLQDCGTGRKFEPRGGQEHGHVGAPLMPSVVYFILPSSTGKFKVHPSHFQGSLPQGREVRLLLQLRLGCDAHQLTDVEAPRWAEQVILENKPNSETVSTQVLRLLSQVAKPKEHMSQRIRAEMSILPASTTMSATTAF